MSHRICLVRVYTRTCYARGVCGWGYGIEKWYPRYTREVPYEEVDVWKEDGSRVEKVSEMFEGGEAVVDV